LESAGLTEKLNKNKKGSSKELLFFCGLNLDFKDFMKSFKEFIKIKCDLFKTLVSYRVKDYDLG